MAGTMPFLEAIALRYSSAMTRVRSAWERIRLSNSGEPWWVPRRVPGWPPA